ncbi:MAG: formate dehydrogenase subunit gamma [Gammaproteobacteria bacterium]|nr:formate dehydrogenase subunit gamma [Gammaproteobacteria bacterium]
MTRLELAASKKTKEKSRGKAMLWSLMFILLSAMLLPGTSYLLTSDEVYAQVNDDQNQRSNFWRAVRHGQSGYSAVSGTESGVLINDSGQNWREIRNDIIVQYGGWAVLLAGIGVLLFFVVKGRIPVDGEKSGLTVPRWSLFERVMHWYTAALFVVLAITGLSMLFGKTVLIPLFGAKGFSLWASLSINVHNVVGPFFTIGVFAMLLFWVKNNIPNATDLKWFAKGGGIIGNAHPSAGKANGGEKLWYWIVILVGLAAVCGSGLVLIGWIAQWGLIENTRAVMQSAHLLHAIAAIIWTMVFFGHAYIGTLGTEGALEGMTTGRVGVEWAKQHHDEWYEEVKNDVSEAPSNPSNQTHASTT